MAATGQWAPDRFDSVLQSRASTVPANVFQNPKLASGANDPDEFVDDCLRICDTTQDKRHDCSVELIVRKRERLTVAVHNCRVETEFPGPSSGTIPHRVVGIDAVHGNAFVGEVRERRSTAATEVEYDTIEIRSKIPAVLVEHRIEIPFGTAVRVGEDGVEHTRPL